MKTKIMNCTSKLAPLNQVCRMAKCALTWEESDIEQINREDNGFADFVKRTLDIQELSSPKLTGIASPDEYSAALRQNYQQIGELSLQNRDLISNDLMPVLQSEGELPDEEASSLRELSDMMLDAYAVESVDIFFRDLINKRLMQDARSRNDAASVIRELDKELENNCFLATQMARITSDSSIFFGCLERAIAAHDELMTYLEPSRFEALDAESRETVMVDSRYGITFLITQIEKAPVISAGKNDLGALVFQQVEIYGNFLVSGKCVFLTHHIQELL